jgi:hypothetical protein
MAEQKSNWSWISAERIFGSRKLKKNSSSLQPGDLDDEENPWFAIHKQTHTSENQPEPYTEVPIADSQGIGHVGPGVRWLSEDHSPYGFSDDDGTLKQIENSNWRKLFGSPRKKRFTPVSMAQQPSGLSAKNNQVKVFERNGSTWLMQTVAAAALIGVGIYAHSGHTGLAKKVQSVYRSAFQTDYTLTAMPAVERYLTAHHISLPNSLAVDGALRLHEPLVGTIKSDYSQTHPEILLAGNSDEVVQAAGSGNVTKVVTLSKGNIMVAIDHGTLGTSLYFGLGSASVHTNQYVSSGQVIGRLPKQQTPLMRFALERHGQYINPHDYIHFTSAGV